MYIYIYTGLGYFIRITHIWVHLINERQQETHGLFGKKANSIE